MTITLEATGNFQVAADWITNTLSGKNGKKHFIYLHLLITVWTCFFASDLMILITYVLVYYTIVVGRFYVTGLTCPDAFLHSPEAYRTQYARRGGQSFPIHSGSSATSTTSYPHYITHFLAYHSHWSPLRSPSSS